MSQYQSFPGESGASRSLDKLNALHLPQLTGRTFLDVGCNEGFFCGFAHFQGAARSVGIDQSKGFIARARARFPECEFHVGSWDSLPEGQFDVILLASALHYADDQAALIRKLVEKLSPDGVLVLELGIATSKEDAWITVERGIDVRQFPSMPKLHAILKDYAWKWMGPSVNQDGDPVKRQVVHVRQRWHTVYLLMQPPGYGKTSIAKSLFEPAGVHVVSGDEVLRQIASAKLKTSKTLHAMVKREFTPYSVDRLMAAIFDAGMGDELIDTWLAFGGERNIALDAFVPQEHQSRVQQSIDARGRLPVVLSWNRIGAPPLSGQALLTQAEAYYLSLQEAPDARPRVPFSGSALLDGTTGFVDEARFVDGQLELRGWAVSGSGLMPGLLVVTIDGEAHVVEGFRKQQRPDVQRHFGLGHDLLGFLAMVTLAPDERSGKSPRIEVAGGDDIRSLSRPFPMSAAATRGRGRARRA